MNKWETPQVIRDQCEQCQWMQCAEAGRRNFWEECQSFGLAKDPEVIAAWDKVDMTSENVFYYIRMAHEVLYRVYQEKYDEERREEGRREERSRLQRREEGRSGAGYAGIRGVGKKVLGLPEAAGERKGV